jgi:hypothetical protein
MESKGIN